LISIYLLVTIGLMRGFIYVITVIYVYIYKEKGE